MSTTWNIVIIGAGASGLSCAVSYAERMRQTGHRGPLDVLVVEESSKVGRSILASGNGRCNLSNVVIDTQRYHNAAFVQRVTDIGLDLQNAPHPLTWFSDLGLLWREERDGMVFPASNRARQVVEVLLQEALRLGVKFSINTRIECVECVPGTHQAPFVLKGQQGHPADQADDNGAGTSTEAPLKSKNSTASRKKARLQDLIWRPFEMHAHKVVVATGGAPSASLVPGVAIDPPHPVLAPLLARVPQELDGLRVRARVSLPKRGFEEEGEVLFRTYGLSGIVMFNASRYVQSGDTLELDLFSEWETDKSTFGLERMLLKRRADALAIYSQIPLSYEQLLSGILARPLAHYVLKSARLDPSVIATEEGISKLAASCRVLSFIIDGVAEGQTYQVVRGGCDVSQFVPVDLSCKKLPGLHVLGEALDVDGPCGGYNLNWAWTTGIVCGTALALA